MHIILWGVPGIRTGRGSTCRFNGKIRFIGGLQLAAPAIRFYALSSIVSDGSPSRDGFALFYGCFSRFRAGFFSECALWQCLRCRTRPQEGLFAACSGLFPALAVAPVCFFCPDSGFFHGGRGRVPVRCRAIVAKLKHHLMTRTRRQDAAFLEKDRAPIPPIPCFLTKC